VAACAVLPVELNMARNRIGPKGARALAEALLSRDSAERGKESSEKTPDASDHESAQGSRGTTPRDRKAGSRTASPRKEAQTARGGLGRLSALDLAGNEVSVRARWLLPLPCLQFSS
jgi:hypothetical protein